MTEHDTDIWAILDRLDVPLPDADFVRRLRDELLRVPAVAGA